MPGVITPGGPHVEGYRDLAALLRAQITAGELAPGWALPSERQLRETYGLGKHTIRSALAMLRAEGLIVVRRGYGAIVRESADREDLVLRPGDTAVSRMPSPDERERLGLDDGVPVVHVLRPDGTGDLYPADRIRIVAGSAVRCASSET